jgi:BioD-like phosphotransacetylase family protein
MPASNSVFAKIANNAEENLEIVVGIQDANENNPHVNVENETNKNLDEEIGHEENTCDIHETNEQGVVENKVESFFAEKQLTKPTSKPKKENQEIQRIPLRKRQKGNQIKP